MAALQRTHSEHHAEPENTLPAFERAFDLGAEGVEIDIQLTADDELVVIHDATVDRTTDGSGNVRDLTLAQLRELDAGDGAQIPLYSEVLELAQRRNGTVLAELKQAHRYSTRGFEFAALEGVCSVSMSMEPLEAFVGFDPQALKALQANAGVDNTPVGRAYTFTQNTVGMRPEGPLVLVSAEMLFLNPWIVPRAHNNLQVVYVFFGTYETQSLYAFIASLGVDGLVVSDVQAAQAALGR